MDSITIGVLKRSVQDQFGVATKGGCEAIIHSIKCALNLHPNWVVLQLDMVNTFNLMSKGSYLKNFVQHVGASYNSSSLLVHFMHSSLLRFIVIIIVKVMSQSSHLAWGLSWAWKIIRIGTKPRI
jgi:hypothetical protein